MDRQTKKEQQTAYRERRAMGGVYAIKNNVSGKTLLAGTPDINSMKNRFEFSCQTGGAVNPKLQKDWEQYGPKAFTFEVLETLEQGELQTTGEFRDDIKTLEEMWREKFDPAVLY